MSPGGVPRDDVDEIAEHDRRRRRRARATARACSRGTRRSARRRRAPRRAGCRGMNRQIAASITHMTYATSTIVAVLTAASRRTPARSSLRLRVGIGRRRRREQHLDRAHARHVDGRLDLDLLEHAVVAIDLRRPCRRRGRAGSSRRGRTSRPRRRPGPSRRACDCALEPLDRARVRVGAAEADEDAATAGARDDDLDRRRRIADQRRRRRSRRRPC